MNLIERKKCAITGSEDLEPLYTFKNFPVFMGCTDKGPEHDIKADMCWKISRSSGVIQLGYLLPLDVLYPEAHGAGCVGKLWKTHHQTFAHFIHKFNPQIVLEIGGSHGILETEYHTSFNQIPWTIVEPNPTPVENCKATFIKGFFDDKFTSNENYDTVIHSHLFEHIYEPDVFMMHLSDFVKVGNRLIFSVPNLEVMLKRKYTNSINFEHTVYLAEVYIEFLLLKYGFKLETKEYFLEDHSIFYCARKENLKKIQPLPDGLYNENKKLYEEYIAYFKKQINDLNDKLKTQSAYIFGAHVFTQYLLEFGLDSSNIICILDNDKNKQGKRLYGTNLKVESPKILQNIDNPFIILKAGVYNNEIKKDIFENINDKAHFWD